MAGTQYTRGPLSSHRITAYGARWCQQCKMAPFGIHFSLWIPDSTRPSLHKLQSTSGYCQRDWHHLEVLHSLSTYWKQFLGLIRQRSVACQSVGPFSAGFFISVMKWFIWWRIAMDQPNTPFWGVGNTLDILISLLSFMSAFNDAFWSRMNFNVANQSWIWQ